MQNGADMIDVMYFLKDMTSDIFLQKGDDRQK
jgi:hypothetical protein